MSIEYHWTFKTLRDAAVYESAPRYLYLAQVSLKYLQNHSSEAQVNQVNCAQMFHFDNLPGVVSFRSGVCKRNESESVSMSALRVSFQSQMGRCTVFHGRCAVFWGGCTVFQGGCAVFCCGTALTYKLCILLLLDYFYPRNDGFVSCLPFIEYVQTLFTLNWACANSVLGMCRNNLHNLPCFWQFWLITMTQT